MKVYSPSVIRISCLKNAALPQPVEFSNKARGAVRILYNAELNKLPGMTDVDEARYLCWGYVLCPEDKPFKPLHSSDLTPQQFNSLGRWATERGDDGAFHMRQSFPEELAQVLTMARNARLVQESAGQLNFGDILDRYAAGVTVDIDAANARQPEQLQDTVADALRMGGVVTAVVEDAPKPEPEQEAFNLGF